MENSGLTERLNLTYLESGSKRPMTLDELGELDPSKSYRLSIRTKSGASIININKSVDEIKEILNKMSLETNLERYSIYLIDRPD
ncbi:MAG: hypothetical protein AABX79_02080 [Nanoarchaeota archaeon]